MKKQSNNTKKIQNRRAKFDYDLDDSIVAGLVLNGRETKSLRLGHGHLRGAYITVKEGELWLINATITGFSGGQIDESEHARARKLLMKKKEIDRLIASKQQGKAIVPIELLTKGRFIKVRIAAGKGKKRYDKRQNIKKRDQDRETNRSLARK